MNLEDLLEQIICDRIEMLLNARSDEILHEERELNHSLFIWWEEFGLIMKERMKRSLEHGRSSYSLG